MVAVCTGRAAIGLGFVFTGATVWRQCLYLTQLHIFSAYGAAACKQASFGRKKHRICHYPVFFKGQFGAFVTVLARLPRLPLALRQRQQASMTQGRPRHLRRPWPA